MMVEVQFQILGLHAGIYENIIMIFMNGALKKAIKRPDLMKSTLDNHIGLFADLISNQMFNGELIHPNIRLFSACNSYHLYAKTQSEAGLTTKVKKYEE